MYVNVYDPRMCVVTEFAIIIGYLQTCPRTIIADFIRKWPTIYDNHLKAPVSQEYHRKLTMSVSEYILFRCFNINNHIIFP